MAEVPNEVLMAWALVVVVGHCWATAEDARSLTQQVWAYISKNFFCHKDSTKRVDAAMNRLREENYVMVCRVTQHVNLFAMPLVPVCYRHDALLCIYNVLSFLPGWLVTVAVVSGHLRVSTQRLRYLFVFYYLLSFSATWSLPPDDKSAWIEKLLSVAQFWAVVSFVDSSVHIPAQLLFTMFVVARRVFHHGVDSSTLQFALAQSCFFLIVSATSLVLECTLRDRLAAQFGTADAEHMTQSFGRMLRGVCDGELLLDDQLRIQGSGGGLRRILSTREDLSGVSFTKLLAQEGDELNRFEHFISRCHGHVLGGLCFACLGHSIQ